jgi:SNF2 family DNA or RNA helicase
MDEQAKDRVHRIGQIHEVRVYRLITATRVEEGILARATYKKGLENKIIVAGMFNENASDLERQHKLEELIRKNVDDDDDEHSEDKNSESEIPSFK